MLAAKTKTLSDGEVLPQAKTRVWGLPPENANGVGDSRPASSTLHWGWSPFYAGTASGQLDQRYYGVGTGRFNVPDPMHSAALGDPGSWNQYAYVGGDPLNFADPGGTNRLACDQYTLEGTCVGQSLGGGGVAWFTNFWWSPEGTLMAIATSSYGSPESAADPQGSSTGGMPSLAVLRHIFLDPAIQGAETLLNDPDCQSLFDTLSMDSNFGTTNPAQILQGAVDHNQVWFGPFGADVGQSVPAQTTGTQRYDSDRVKQGVRHWGRCGAGARPGPGGGEPHWNIHPWDFRSLSTAGLQRTNSIRDQRGHVDPRASSFYGHSRRR